jgi:hypothetical protein
MDDALGDDSLRGSRLRECSAVTPEGALSALEQNRLRVYGNAMRLVLAN